MWNMRASVNLSVRLATGVKIVEGGRWHWRAPVGTAPARIGLDQDEISTARGTTVQGCFQAYSSQALLTHSWLLV